MPLISVVVPIYDVEEYLHQCVDSILSQSYRNLEIILVDDGSPDACPQICDCYATKDSRIRVIHKINGGLSDARNAGINCASGEYILFVDSDDFIHPEMISFLYKKISTHSVDISVCSMKKVYSPEDYIDEDDIIYDDSSDVILSAQEAIEALLVAKDYGSVMACNKLFTADLFRKSNIRFPVGKLHEDVFTTYQVYYLCDKISFSNCPLYNYRQRPESIMGSAFTPRRMDALDAADEILDFIESKKLPLKKQGICHYLLTNIGLINTIIRDDKGKLYTEYIKKLRSNIFKRGFGVFMNPHLSFKNRIGIIFLFWGFWIYTPICKLFFLLKNSK